MIFYFSGTGNSMMAAKNIAEKNGECLISIASVMNSCEVSHEYNLMDEEMIGFVFPVYSWGPPKMVIEFIKKLKLNNYRDNYTFSVATCGENIGNTIKVISSALKKRQITLNSGFSIVMPNNYIIIGDIDKKEIEHKKLSEAEDALKYINNIIGNREKNIFNVIKGPLPAILTGVINPLFNKWAINTRKFYANDKCTGCGICESICNSKTIKVDGKPRWQKQCIQCLACIHYCPAAAIQYGKRTVKKGRYTNPTITLQEMKKV